ncbi:MAG: hypothetical protein MJ181_11515 [Treponema sp.]|nr:hypothetical protein [Treponema sp.]
MNGEELIGKLESLMREFDFESSDVNVDYILAECVIYIRNIEKQYKELSDLNAILRHNLKVAERKNRK